MKQTQKDSNNTSFHGHVIKCRLADLRTILGQPEYENNDGSDKVNFDWTMETESGLVFTVYDWKQYRRVSEEEIIAWHIGGKSEISTSLALVEITSALTNLYNS